MRTNETTLTWQIHGDFITDLARSWFWDEGREYEKSEELLLSCMGTDEITLEEKKDYCQKIIEGKLKFVGINTFTLEDDGENIRPITLMLEKQKRKIGINEIKEHMKIYPMNYIDIYSTVESYERALYEGVRTFEEVIMYFAGQHDYFGKWRQDVNHESYIETIERYTTTSTKCGLWLLDNPELIYDLNKGPLYENNLDDFFKKLYNHLSLKVDLDYYMKERQQRYAASIRINENKMINENDKIFEELKEKIKETKDEEIKNWELHKQKPDDMSLKEYDAYLKDRCDRDNYAGCLPDDMISEYGLIAPNGDYYSSTFGGHNLKAYYIICGLYKQFGYEKRISAEMRALRDTALDELIDKGWIAIRYLPGKGDYLTWNKIKRPTKAQINRIYDVMIKFKKYGFNGLKELEEE